VNGVAAKMMDERVEAFLADILALEGETLTQSVKGCARLAIQSGYQLEFKFGGGSKPASFQTERFSGAAINFTKADAAFCAALSVVAAAP
jgi:hypothetical protein